MCLYAGIRSFIKSLLHFSLLSAAALLNFLIFPLPCKYNIYAPWSLSSPSQNLSFPVFSAASPDIPGWPQSQQLQTHQFPFVKPFYPLLFPRSYRASFPPHHCAALCHAAGEQGLPWDSVLGLIPSLTVFSLNPASPMKTIKPLPPFCLSYFCNLTSSMKKATIKYLIPQATICSLFRSEIVLLLPRCWWYNSLPCTLTLLTAAHGQHRPSTSTKLHVTTNNLLLALS